MTRPKPPEPYETWMDYSLSPHQPTSAYGLAAAELGELRAEIKALRAELKARKAEPCPACGVIRQLPDPADECLRIAKESK